FAGAMQAGELAVALIFMLIVRGRWGSPESLGRRWGRAFGHRGGSSQLLAQGGAPLPVRGRPRAAWRRWRPRGAGGPEGAEGPMSAIRQLAFVDAGVSGLSSLLLGLQPGVEAIVLEARTPALAQIAARLRDTTGLEAIHVFAHGQPGEISFAGGVLTYEQ